MNHVFAFLEGECRANLVFPPFFYGVCVWLLENLSAETHIEGLKNIDFLRMFHQWAFRVYQSLYGTYCSCPFSCKILGFATFFFFFNPISWRSGPFSLPASLFPALTFQYCNVLWFWCIKPNKYISTIRVRSPPSPVQRLVRRWTHCCGFGGNLKSLVKGQFRFIALGNIMSILWQGVPPAKFILQGLQAVWYSQSWLWAATTRIKTEHSKLN